MHGWVPVKAARFSAALLVSIAVVGMTATSALAKGTPPQKWSYTFTGLKAGEWYGPVSCTGKHETNEKKGYPGTETSGGKDVEKCKSTTGKPLELVTPGEHVALGTGEFPGASGWSSDDPALAGLESKDIEYTVAANGKSFKLVAIY